MIRNGETQTQEKEYTSVDELIRDALGDTRKLVVHNDEVNTFDFVTACLIDVCGHEKQQAEQCTLLIHYKGKCVVREGTDEEKLADMCAVLCDRGLSAELQ